MTHMLVWHDNGNRTRTFGTCGYTEEFTDRTPEEVRADYEAHGCRVFAVDVINDQPSPSA